MSTSSRELSFRRRPNTTAEAGEPELIRRHRPDYLLVVFMVFLMMLGLVVLYSINMALAQSYDNNFALKQAVFLGLGLSVFMFAARAPLHWFEKYASKLLLAGIISSLLLALLGFAHSSLANCSGGACRWYAIGSGGAGLSFQPAELLKFGLLMYLAVFLSSKIRQGQLNNVKETLIPAGVVIALLSFLVIGLQKDMGTGLVVLAIAFGMLIMAGLKGRYVLAVFGAIVAAGSAFVVIAPHRIARVLTFVGHDSSNDAANYHIQQALIGIGSGGFFGKGLGQSIQAFGYLPEAANDSIFAIVAETFGFAGTIIILVAYAFLVYRLLVVLQRSERPELKLIMAGVVSWIGAQAIINIAAMVGLIPLTGITLPFLSFGGTSLLFTMLLMGVAFNISHYTSYRQTITKGNNKSEDSSGRRRIGRTRNARSERYQRA